MQSSSAAKFVAGSSVNVVEPPETAAGWPPLVAQEMENQLPSTTTGSLKVIETFASRATPAALFAGVVETTIGAGSPSSSVVCDPKPLNVSCAKPSH